MLVTQIKKQNIEYCHDEMESWWRNQMETFSALLALCLGKSPVPVNSPRKGQWRGTLMFSLICAWINDWVNNRHAGDLRRHCVHYDVNVMYNTILTRRDTITFNVIQNVSSQTKITSIHYIMNLIRTYIREIHFLCGEHFAEKRATLCCDVTVCTVLGNG